MFQEIRSGRATFKPVRSHPDGSKRAELHQFTRKTLGSGDMRAAVVLPASEELNDWINVNTVDFFNEASLIYGMVAEEAEHKFVRPGEGFPPGFEYLWSDASTRTPIKCSAHQYVDYVMSWAEDQVNDESIFPVDSEQQYPDNFVALAKSVFKRLFRVFAIVYCSLFDCIESMGAAPHLNTSFKHFVFFILEFDLVDSREFEPVQQIIESLLQDYNSSTS